LALAYIDFNFRGVLKINLKLYGFAFYYVAVGIGSSADVSVLSPNVPSLSKFVYKREAKFPSLVISGEATTRHIHV
jgi:hypothetical protein